MTDRQPTMQTPPPLSQNVHSTTTRSAIFLVATINPGADHADTIRSWCGDIAALVRSVGKRVPGGNLTCVCGFGADA